MKSKINWAVVGILAIYGISGLALAREIKTTKIELAECREEVAVVQELARATRTRVDNLEVRTTTIEFEMDLEYFEETNPINYDYDYVLRVVAAESRGEPLEGQMGVAQTIHETAKATGQTPEQVVKVPGQYAPPTSMANVNDSVREACERVFVFNEKVTEEPIRYFYSTVGGFYSRWHENSLEYVMTIGNHKFFKAKG